MSGPDATSSPADLLLDADERAGLHDRWVRIEEHFVDDPAAAVGDADRLIERVIERIRVALDERRAANRQRWDPPDDVTTEQLREALHHYEVLFAQLAKAPAPTGWRQDGTTAAGAPDAPHRPSQRSDRTEEHR